MSDGDRDQEDNQARRGGSLLTAFVERYPELVRTLGRRFGSIDRAQEALHEVWLKLERGGNLGEVRDPGAYLARAAINADYQTAKTRLRQQALMAGNESLVAWEGPAVEEVAIWRSEWNAMRRAVDQLPPRRRAIFLAVYGEELPLPRIAELHGISVRTVQTELKAAFEQLSWDVEK